MKFISKYQLLFSVVLVSLLLCSCKSREEKIADLIRQDMFENLYDFDSYEPIATEIDTAYSSLYTDSACVSAVLKWMDCTHQLEKLAKRAMEIDEMPSYERELLDEEDLMTEMTNELIAVSEEMAKNYNKVRSVDSTFVDNSVIGWEVNHKFRAKNEEGVYKLYTYTYIFNEDCTEIRFSINEASGDYLQIRKQIDDFLSTEDFSSLIASIMAEMEREYYYGN